MKKLLPFLALLLTLSSRAQIRITEINYNSDSTVNSSNWFELHNAGASAVSLNGWTAKPHSFPTSFSFPNGTTMQPGAYLVVVSNDTEFTAIHPSVSNFVGNTPFQLNNTADTIELYDNSSTLVESVAYFDSIPWLKGADGFGRTLEVVNENGNANDPHNWFNGCMFGSPGTAYTPCNDPIVVNEINYSSNVNIDAGDWIELYNRTNSTISLNGYSLKDDNDTHIYFFPVNASLPAHGFLVAYSDYLKFHARHPNALNIAGPFSFGYGKTDAVRIFSPAGKLMFSVAYRDSLPWNWMASGAGYTLELVTSAQTGHIQDPANWICCTLEGSPLAFTGCAAGVEENDMLPVDMTVLGNPIAQHQLCLQCRGDAFLLHQSRLDIRSLNGSLICSFPHPETQNTLALPALPDGIYFIQLVLNGKTLVTRKFVKND